MNDNNNNSDDFSVKDQFAGQNGVLGERNDVAGDAGTTERVLGGGDDQTVLPVEPLCVDAGGANIIKTLDFGKILSGMFRKGWLALLCIVIMAVLGVMGGKKLQKESYAAKVKMLYSGGKKTVVKAGNKSSFMLSSLGRETCVKMLSLSVNAEDVINLLGLDMSKADLMWMIGVTSDKRSEMVGIEISGAPTEDECLQLVNTYAEVAIENNRLFYKNQILTLFEQFDTRAKDAKVELDNLNKKIVDFQIENGILELSAEHQVYLQTLSATAERLSNAQIEHNEILVQIQNYSNLVATLPDEVVQESYESNPVKRRISNTEVALMEARTRYGPDNPKVQLIEREITELRRMLNDGSFEETREKTYGPNPMKLQYRATIIELEMRELGAEQTAKKLEQELTEMEARFKDMPATELVFASLLRQKDTAESIYQALKDSAEDASLALQMEFGDFKILQLASDAEASGSLLAIIFPVFCIFVGIGAGVVLVLIWELLDRHLRTIKQVESLYTPPCIVAIPDYKELTPDTAYHYLLNSLREISTRLNLLTKGQRIRSLGFVSARDDEGKSSLAFNLARYYTGLKIKTAYIDFDHAQNPFLDSVVAGQNVVGLQEYLRGTASFEDISATHSGVGVFKVTALTQDMQELVKSAEMARLWDTISDTYDLIITENPPLCTGSAGAVLAGLPEHVLFIIGSGVAPKKLVDKAMNRIETVSIAPLGIVFNKVGAAFLKQEQEPEPPPEIVTEEPSLSEASGPVTRLLNRMRKQ